MQSSDGRLRLSPSDLSGFLACQHLTQLQLSILRGERDRPVFRDPYADMIRQKGGEHEAAYLAGLSAAGRRVVMIPNGDADEARRLTEETIRAGMADVIYQAYLTDGTWHGYADFLELRPDGGYEPVDTKLARSPRPNHVLQLCFYAEQLARIQGRPVENVHLE